VNIAHLEDDIIQQTAFRELAESLGHQVTSFVQVEPFKLALKDSEFKLIVLDNLLEDFVDSFEQLEDIRSIVGPTVGIVGLTGAAAFSELKIAYPNLGLMNHVLFKPASIDDLESAIFFIGGEG
jgi:DNA-binding NtrC family response regulator